MSLSTNANLEEVQNKVLRVLTRHPSRTRAISMVRLHEAVFGASPRSKINGTRQLRKAITALREEGQPIGSTGEGYYLATTHQELSDYCERLRAQGLRKLALEAGIRKTSLPALLHEIQLNMEAR